MTAIICFCIFYVPGKGELQLILHIHGCRVHNTEGQLYHSVVYKELRHPRILESMGILEPILVVNKGQLRHAVL